MAIEVELRSDEEQSDLHPGVRDRAEADNDGTSRPTTALHSEQSLPPPRQFTRPLIDFDNDNSFSFEPAMNRRQAASEVTHNKQYRPSRPETQSYQTQPVVHDSEGKPCQTRDSFQCTEDIVTLELPCNPPATLISRIGETQWSHSFGV